MAAPWKAVSTAGCEIKTLADDENKTGWRVAKALAATLLLTSQLACAQRARLKSSKRFPAPFSVFPRIYGPNMDGHVFPEQPIKTIAAERHPAMPIIIGNTARETWGWFERYHRWNKLRRSPSQGIAAAARDLMLKLYPVNADASAPAACAQVTTELYSSAGFSLTQRQTR